MPWRQVPVGDVGVLLCGPDDVVVPAGQVTGLYRQLVSGAARATMPAVVLDVVPAAATVLVHHEPGRAAATLAGTWVRQRLARLEGDASAAEDPADQQVEPGVVELTVCYDGADLAEVGRLTGLGVAGVVAAHSTTLWTVAFTGFAPGFGYLVPAAAADESSADPAAASQESPSDPAARALAALLAVPRRAEPRVRVPGGAVALAGGYTGVYPRSGPGGWQLLGRTAVPVWDLDVDPPALLRPGGSVRFVPVSA